MNILRLTCLATLVATPTLTMATAVQFDVGTGYPFFGKVELAIPANARQDRWFVNYKVGLDDGVSIGYEHALDSQQQHALGIVVGTIGARDGDLHCEQSNNIFCPLADILDNDATNGAAVRYSYSVNGLNNAGFKLTFELGYGEVSHLNEKRVDGGIAISYQF